MTENWPVAELNPVQRLRVLAAGIPGAEIVERIIPAPVSDVWAILSDFEEGFGKVQVDMRNISVQERKGDRVTILARSRFGMRARLEGELRPGWCWLQSRLLIIGMAVTPAGTGSSRVALTGGIRVPNRAAVIPVGVRWAANRSLDRLGNLVEHGGSTDAPEKRSEAQKASNPRHARRALRGTAHSPGEK